MKKPLSIGIIGSGYLPLDFGKVSKLIKQKKSPYSFSLDSLKYRLGPPDLGEIGYSDEAIQSSLSSNQRLDKYDIVVIITSSPIEKSHLTRTIDRNIIAITSYQTDTARSKSKRSLEEYIAIAICEELGFIEFNKASNKPMDDLFHTETVGCLFDFTTVKSDIAANKLASCGICKNCKKLFENYNIDENILTFLKKVLRNIRRPKLIKALKVSVANPGISFIYGILFGLLINIISTFLNSGMESLTNYQIIIFWVFLTTILIFPVAVYVYFLIIDFRKRIKRA